MSAAEGSKPRDGLLWDSQWVNIVNHAERYRDIPKDDAVHLAVKLTRDTIECNIVELYGKTPRQLADEVEQRRADHLSSERILFARIEAIESERDSLRGEVERLRAGRDALLAAARGVEGRIYEAARSINDATRWADEESIDGSAETLESWVTSELNAAIALAEQQQAGGES